MYAGLEYDLSEVMVLVRESGLLTSLATFQQRDGILIPPGSQSGNYIDVPGLVSIACMDAPKSTSNILATEAKAMEEIEAKRFRHILLDDYYPQVPDGIASGWRVIVRNFLDGQVVDTLTYDITGAEADSQTRMTRIDCRIVRV